jgi:hypothetical protein
MEKVVLFLKIFTALFYIKIFKLGKVPFESVIVLNDLNFVEFESESNRTAPSGTVALRPTHQRLPSLAFYADHAPAAPIPPLLAVRSPCGHRVPVVGPPPPPCCRCVAPSASPSPTSMRRFKKGATRHRRSLFSPPLPFPCMP